jgi:hypothetical protein
MILKQVIKYDNAEAIEATWVDNDGADVKSHVYSPSQVSDFLTDVPNGKQYLDKFGWTAEFCADYTAKEVAASYVKPDLKMVGVVFDGVMCSATRDDQNGILAVIVAYQLQGETFKPTVFQFVNGTRLTITKENIRQFMGKWMPFRQSFFEPPKS